MCKYWKWFFLVHLTRRYIFASPFNQQQHSFKNNYFRKSPRCGLFHCLPHYMNTRLAKGNNNIHIILFI